MRKKLLAHRVVVGLCAAAGFFVFGGFVWAFFELRGMNSGPLILHASDLGGITSVGGFGAIIFMGIFGLLVTVMNFFIALEFEAHDRFFGKLLAGVTLVFGVLLFLAFASIINLNV